MPSRGPATPRRGGADAAQFAPFAALRGHDELVRARLRVAEPRHELTEEEAEALSRAVTRLSRGSLVAVTHYDGGTYVTTTGAVTRLDLTFRRLWVGGVRICFDDMREMEVLS